MKTKHAKYFEKQTFMTPLKRTRQSAYQGIRNVRFLQHLMRFVFFLPLS